MCVSFLFIANHIAQTVYYNNVFGSTINFARYVFDGTEGYLNNNSGGFNRICSY